MRMPLSIRLFVVLLLFAGLAGCGKKQVEDTSAIVATVGARSITLDQLEEMYKTTPISYRPSEEGLEGLKSFLNTMVQKELLAQAAEDSIGELNPRQKIRLERRTDNIIYELIESSEVRPSLTMTDAEVERFYENRRFGYRPRHILVKSLGEANEVMRLLSEGAVFEALAMQMSIDRKSYRDGGDMGFVSKGDTEPAFEEALLKMKVGETVGPVKTDRGYHIIRLEDQREVALPPLDDDLKERFRMIILSRRGKELKDEFLSRIKDETGVKYYPEPVRLIDRRFTQLWANQEFLDDPASIGSPGVDASKWFPEFLEEERELTLATIGDSTITLGAWIDKLYYAPALVWPKGGGDEWVRAHLDDTYYKDIVIAYGKIIGMRDDEEVLRRRALAREEILVNTFYFTRIDTVSPPTADEVWDYYEENLPRYSLPEDLAQATIFHFNDEAAAREALSQWRAGADDNTVYKAYQEAGKLTEWEPSGKYLRGNTEAELFDVVWTLEAGEYFGPLTIFDDHLIGRMEGKTPAGPIPFEYARERVAQDIWAERKEARLHEVLADLKTKYPVEVHEEVLAGSELAVVEGS
jgi:parvulin-like peptidyl-prolyl isomerase